MLKKVLVPTDLSDETDKVLQYVRGLKELGLREVILVHVKDVRNILPPFTKKQKQKIESRLEEQQKILENGLKVKTLLLKGTPYEEILEAAEKEKVSMIIAGSRGKRLIEELALGSISQKVGRVARLPILLIRYAILKNTEKRVSLEKFAGDTFKKILYPTDFSKCSEKALGYIKKLKALGAKEVIALHVIDHKRLETEQQKKELREIGRFNLERIKDTLTKASFKTRTYLKVSDPLKEILNYAEDKNCSLIVMGTHGKSVVTEWLVGTVSFNVVRMAEKPTLIVHEEDVWR